MRYWSWFRIYVYKKIPTQKNEENNWMSKLKIPTFSESRHRYDADHRRKQKHRVSILFISKKFSSWNLDLHEKELSVVFEHQKECFLNWILAKSVGGKSLLHCGKFFPMDSAYEIGYVMTYLLLDINHEIIFYSNQTDRVKLMSTYKNKRSSRPGRYSRGLIKLWSVEIYGLVSLFCYLERFLFLLLLLRQMFSNCAIILTHNILANSLWSIIQSWYCSRNVKLYIIKPKVVGLSLSQLSLSVYHIPSTK